jgi:hypothetical protein
MKNDKKLRLRSNKVNLLGPISDDLQQITNDQQYYPDQGRTRLVLYLTHVRQVDIGIIGILGQSWDAYSQRPLSRDDEPTSQHDRSGEGQKEAC